MLILLVAEATPLNQLIKLPKLYQHYKEHKNWNPGINFIDFLSMHYGGKDVHYNDEEKDMQLPFRKFDVSFPAFLFIPSNRIFTIKTYFRAIKADFAPDREQVYYNPALTSLFRPPKA